jgi:periplasmic protein TonB
MKAATLVVASVLAASAQSYSAGPQAVTPNAGMQAPAVVSKTSPQYTPQAIEAGIEGNVVLYVEIGTDGRAHRIAVIRGLGYGLDARAKDAVGQWRFRPGTKDGVAVTTSATIEVPFRLAATPI